MQEVFSISTKEESRLKILQQIESKKITQRKAAELLAILLPSEYKKFKKSLEKSLQK